MQVPKGRDQVSGGVSVPATPVANVLDQIQVTALLPFFLSILHTLLQLSKIMLWSTVKLHLAKVMPVIFDPLKSLPRSSKSCDCVTFRVLKYLLLTFSTLYASLSHDLIQAKVLSVVYWCFNREPKSASVLKIRQVFLSIYETFTFLVEPVTYMCNLMAWYINKY